MKFVKKKNGDINKNKVKLVGDICDRFNYS